MAAGVGGTQIIGGKTYKQYTPEWYSAMDANKIQQAGVSGTAGGTAAGAALNALQAAVPNAFDPSGSSSTSSSSSSAGSGVAPVGYPGGSVPAPGTGGLGGGSSPATGLPRVDTTEAQTAAFNRAKDQVGEVSRSALTGLRSALASRGQLGGAGESRGYENIANTGVHELADVAREGAIQESGLRERENALNYNGGISMRGQDIGRDLGIYNGQIAQRGQDVTMRGQDISKDSAAQSAKMSWQNMILEALRSIQY